MVLFVYAPGSSFDELDYTWGASAVGDLENGDLALELDGEEHTVQL